MKQVVKRKEEEKTFAGYPLDVKTLSRSIHNTWIDKEKQKNSPREKAESIKFKKMYK